MTFVLGGLTRGARLRVLVLLPRSRLTFGKSTVVRLRPDLALVRASLQVQRILAGSGLPAVVHGSLHASVPAMSWIDRDHRTGGALMTRHLLSTGFRRIVVLGDSIVWGYGVEDDEVFTSVLEREDPGVEWINLGVSGYGTDQESLLLEREGMRYKPDIVLAEVCENDFDENVHDQVYHIYPKPLFALRQGSLLLTNAPVPRVSLLDRLFYRLETGSYLWRLVNSYRISGRILDALKRCARGAGLSRSVPLPLSSPDQPEQLLVSLLGRTKRIAESNRRT